MNTFFTLVKTQLNTNFGISALKYKFTKEKKKLWEPFLIGFAIICGVGPLLSLYTLFMFSFFTVGKSLGQPELVLTVSLLAAQVLVLIFGIFYFLSSFYFSQDLNMLIPLPVKPYEIVGSKFAVVMCNEYLIVLPAFIPPAVIYGFGTGQGLLYWIKAFLVMVTIPAIPLILDALFVMVLMRFVNLRRHKDALAIIGSFIAIAAAIGSNIFFQRMPENGTQYLKSLLENKGLVTEAGRKFPPSIWATRGLADNSLNGIGYFLLFLCVSVLLFVIMLWLANLVFYKGVTAGQEVTRKRKVLSSDEMLKTYGKASNPVLSIFIREWKLLMRTPVYMINGISGAFIGPIILVIMFSAQSKSPDMAEFYSAMKNPEYAMYVALIGLGLILFTGGMNLVASTSISREGSCFWISKMIPVSAEKQILAKFYSGYSISVIGTVVTAVILVAFAGVSIPRTLIVIVIGLLASVPMTALNLLLDLMHPKLVWNNPQEAMKQNMNGLLGMLISMILVGILGAAAGMMIVLSLAEPLIYLVLGAVSVILGFISIKILFAAAKARYSSLEA